MALSTQPYKGTRDFYPEDMRIRSWMFNKMREVVTGYAYQEYDGPMLEPFDLYAAKTGEEIVNQQLYWMIDRGERKLAVRPEMTPTTRGLVWWLSWTGRTRRDAAPQPFSDRACRDSTPFGATRLQVSVLRRARPLA